jgi:hypothetical protein
MKNLYEVSAGQLEGEKEKKVEKRIRKAMAIYVANSEASDDNSETWTEEFMYGLFTDYRAVHDLITERFDEEKLQGIMESVLNK